ncbi:MAG: PIN domain-containing protein [Clostridiales bacterium]|jgi:predicted nucleic acid-binding protein|nr:PIN domain-containing protein [Clostridiales bacterium]
MTYALDTNILTYLLQKNKQVEGALRDVLEQGNEYAIPPVVYYEFKRWLTVKNAFAQLDKFNRIYRPTQKLPMSERCWDKAVDIYVKLIKSGKIIDDADILISAYCVINGYTLVTNNIRHFERVDGLKLVNWVD